MAISRSFPDHNQNFWQLTCIQASAQNIPAILLGGILAQKYGAGTALTSICIGNLILWLIGIAMVSMTAREKNQAIDNVRTYLGKESGLVMALVLSLVFLSWFMLCIESSVASLQPLFQSAPFLEQIGSIRVGALLGLIVTLLSIGGIRVIKWVCTSCFPFMLLMVLYIILDSIPHSHVYWSWSFSLPAVISVITVLLPGFINLPTFFRHSRSRQDSYLALTLITIFDITFEILTIFMIVLRPEEIFTSNNPSTANSIYVIAMLTIILLSAICNNLVNIYFASASAESIFRRTCGPKEYAIIGLIGTASFVFLQISIPMEFLIAVAYNSLSTLGSVLLATYLVRLIVRHRPRPYEKLTATICWGVGCVAALVTQFYTPENANLAFIYAINTSLLSFLIVVFFEETIWATRKVFSPKRSS